MSNGESDIRNAPPNPAVKLTIHFEQGNTLIWNLKKPWAQADLFMEIGLLGAKFDLGVEFDLPVGDETDEGGEPSE